MSGQVPREEQEVKEKEKTEIKKGLAGDMAVLTVQELEER